DALKKGNAEEDSTFQSISGKDNRPTTPEDSPTVTSGLLYMISLAIANSFTTSYLTVALLPMCGGKPVLWLLRRDEESSLDARVLALLSSLSSPSLPCPPYSTPPTLSSLLLLLFLLSFLHLRSPFSSSSCTVPPFSLSLHIQLVFRLK
ncbi:hypothetical protein Tco_0581776, partial [Tanacetum coccineum]